MSIEDQMALAGYLAEITLYIGLPLAGFFVWRYFHKRKTKTAKTV